MSSILKILEANTSLCMDEVADRRTLAAALNEGLAGDRREGLGQQ